jgi:hypothetical protein
MQAEAPTNEPLVGYSLLRLGVPFLGRKQTSSIRLTKGVTDELRSPIFCGDLSTTER